MYVFSYRQKIYSQGEAYKHKSLENLSLILLQKKSLKKLTMKLGQISLTIFLCLN